MEKNLVDGVEEIWVKKKKLMLIKFYKMTLLILKPDAFAGKLDVINEELVNKANYFKSVLNSIPESSVANVQNSSNTKNSANPFINFFWL